MRLSGLDIRIAGVAVLTTLIWAAAPAAAQPVFVWSDQEPELAMQPPPPPAPMPSGAVFYLQSGGTFLGVGVKEMNAERAKALKLKEEYGVEITMVEPGSPAEKAGLKQGDVVLEYNGQRVEGTQQFVRLVRETPPGRTVRLTVFRDGATQTVTATLEERKGRTFNVPALPKLDDDIRVRIEKEITGAMRDVPRVTMSWRAGMLGIEGEALKGSQLAEFFGVKDGVLVRSVMKDTPAAKAGLKPGDVIVKVDGRQVEEPRDISAALRAAREASKKTIAVVVVREKKETTVQVTLDEPPPLPARAPKAQRVTVPEGRF